MGDQALILPPWDLCGFDREHDPYSLSDEDIRFRVLWHYAGVEIDSVEVEEVSARDPNERDGRWPELAFMPYVPYDPEWWGLGQAVVPAYLSVIEALSAERGRRREAEFAARFEGDAERWEAYARQFVTLAERTKAARAALRWFFTERWPLSPPPRSPHGDPVLR